jgi:hypothetical protein
MSETLRTYGGPVKSSRHKRVKRGGGCFLWACFLVLIIVLLGTWFTRDTYRMVELIPADHAYQVYVDDILTRRITIARSEIWALAPASSEYTTIPDRLAGDWGFPQWILNNLIYGPCHISGDDVQGFGDALMVTHMSRMGCIMAKSYHFMPGVSQDFAGGLRIKRLDSSGLFYAVRGRVLAISYSRNALIQALTLDTGETLPPAALTVSTDTEEVNADLRGHFILPPKTALGDVFEALNVDVHFQERTARICCSGQLRPAWQKQLGPLLGNAGPQSLRRPPDGLIAVSGHFEQSVPQVWNGLAQALDGCYDLPGFLQEFLEMPEGIGPALRQMVSPLLESATGGWQLTLRGIDQETMVPVPRLGGAFEANPARLEQLFSGYPEIGADNAPSSYSSAVYNTAENKAVLSLVGGPEIEVQAGIRKDSLVLGSGKTIFDALMKDAAPTEDLQTPGNLYVRVQPAACIEEMVSLCEELARYDLLNDASRTWLDTRAITWSKQARRIREAAVLAGHSEGLLSFDLLITMAGE